MQNKKAQSCIAYRIFLLNKILIKKYIYFTQFHDLLTPQVAYSLMTQLAQAFWVPRANGLYDTKVQIKSGQAVKTASGHQTIFKPTVVSVPKVQAATAKPAVHVDPSLTNNTFVQKVGRTKEQKRAAAVKRAIAEERAGIVKTRKKAGQRCR